MNFIQILAFFLLFLQTSFAFPQCVSVELSLSWAKEHDIFNEDSLVCVPSLSITYRNNSETSIYFLKVSDSHLGYPLLPRGLLLQYPYEDYINPDYRKRAINHGNYSGKDFKVIILNRPYYNKSWEVFNDTLAPDGEYVTDIINDDLVDIYEYIFHKHFQKETDSLKTQKPTFSINESSTGNIVLDNIERFVFLKPGETYSNTFNLIGFQKVGGSFTFDILSSGFDDYVFTDYSSCKIPLPNQVDGYKLYSGSFKSNKITITF